MTGLVLKDLILVKSQAKIYLLLLAFYTVLAITGIYSLAFFSGFSILLMLMLPISIFSLDDSAHWDKYAVALPTGRRGIVGGRYLFALCVMGVAFSVVAVANAGICLLRGELASLPEALIASLICSLLGLLINCLIMPLAFKFGAEKGRTILVLCAVALFFLVFIGAKFLQEHDFALPASLENGISGWLLYLLPVLGFALVAAVLLVSYRISLHIYTKKEF